MGVERLDAPVPQGFGDAVVERERERRVARRFRRKLSPLDELFAELRVVAQSVESGVGEQESLRESMRVRSPARRRVRRLYVWNARSSTV
jgi:hypothetical protein